MNASRSCGGGTAGQDDHRRDFRRFSSSMSNTTRPHPAQAAPHGDAPLAPTDPRAPDSVAGTYGGRVRGGSAFLATEKLPIGGGRRFAARRAPPRPALAWRRLEADGACSGACSTCGGLEGRTNFHPAQFAQVRS